MKTSFVSAFNPGTSKKKGTIKSSYKNDYVNGNVDIDLDYAGPNINSAIVCGWVTLIYCYIHTMAWKR